MIHFSGRNFHSVFVCGQFAATCPSCRSAETYGVRHGGNSCLLCVLENDLTGYDELLFRNAPRARIFEEQRTQAGEYRYLKHFDASRGVSCMGLECTCNYYTFPFSVQTTLNRGDSQYVIVLRALAKELPSNLESVAAGLRNLVLLKKETFVFRQLWIKVG